MGELLSCPFCRELFAEDEGPRCPECDLPLVPLRDLPLSREGLAELAAEEDVDPPEDQRLPALYLGRGRGAGVMCALGGLALFFAPWVSLKRPDEILLSGQELAASSSPWLWGGAVGWFILVPLFLSRRTVNEMVGIRVVAAFFPLLTLGEVSLLLLRPPIDHRYFSSGLEYGWGLYASGLVALCGILIGARLGGSQKDLRDLPVPIPPSGPRGGESLH
jgi:hypothetical protein